METNSLYKIRPYQRSDVQAAYEAILQSQNELRPWMPWCHPNYSIEDTIDWVEYAVSSFESGKEYNFVIFNTQTGQIAGGTGLNDINRLNLTANLGYWVRTLYTRKGVATQAALQVAHFGFRELGLVRLEIMAAVENKASQHVAEKVGAVKEGVLRKRLQLWGKAHDAVLYSLLTDEFPYS